MASYRIEKNAQYNSNEIYFDSKPAAEVLTALRGLKMRWNPKKGCWYGFAAQNDIIAAIGEHDNELGGTISDGYLGATRWDGNKSGKYLHGAELSKAIREELKAQGIKGVSVSCKTYSGGQHITAKIKITEADMTSREQYIADYTISTSRAHIYIGDRGESIHIDEYYKLDSAERERIRQAAAEYDYRQAAHGRDINRHSIDEETAYTADTLRKLHKVTAIIEAYRYNDSNSMVDYFDTNFYYDLQTVAA